MLNAIETMDEWNDLLKTLLEFDYRIWQIPYCIDDNSGLHALFQSRGESVIEVTTHNQEVVNAIQAYPYL